MFSPSMKSNLVGLKRYVAASVFVVVLTASAASPALADWHHDRGPGPGPGAFHGWNDHQWRGGGWYHGVHEGRPGWWWHTGGRWYNYDRPVYPYPANPYGAPEVYAPPVYAAPPPPPEPGINLIVPLHIR